MKDRQTYTYYTGRQAKRKTDIFISTQNSFSCSECGLMDRKKITSVARVRDLEKDKMHASYSVIPHIKLTNYTACTAAVSERNYNV